MQCSRDGSSAASFGVHKQGRSLVRRIIATRMGLGSKLPDGRTLGDTLLEPTRIYVRALLPVVRSGHIHDLAHITGGGIVENVPRVLPDNCHAFIDARAWPLPQIFMLLQTGGDVEPSELARTFNCGIGMVAIVPSGDADTVVKALEAAGETVHRIGSIEAGPRGCTVHGPAGSWGSDENWTATHHA